MNTRQSLLMLAHRVKRVIQEPELIGQQLRWRLYGPLTELLDRRAAKHAERQLAKIDRQSLIADRVLHLARVLGVDRSLVEMYSTEFLSDLAFHQEIDAKLASAQTIRPQSTTPFEDLHTLYCIVRLVRPRQIVETGVHLGGTSAYLLLAMKRNGHGHLYSIDLPMPSLAPFGNPFGQGCLVPDYLQAQWSLVVGDSREELPRLLQSLGEIDMFHHDSLHTFRAMMREYHTAWPFIRQGGVLTSHDIVRNRAFGFFCTFQRIVSRSSSARLYNIGVLHHGQLP